MTHAIAARDDLLYTCNARVDVLGVHDLASGEERFVEVGSGLLVNNPQHLKPLASGYAHDRHHPNAVVVHNGLITVMVHDFDDEGATTSALVIDESTLSVVDRVRLDDRPLGVPYAHDLAAVDGGYLWCDTFRCRVRHSDGRSSPRLGDESIFLRGLAADDHDVYVGATSVRGGGSIAEIVRLDTTSLREIERRPVPMPVEICTVRIASGLDHAHPDVGGAPIAFEP
jgi:hypothetical protein